MCMDRKTILRCRIFPTDRTFHTTPIKTPASYFVDVNELILKFMWKGKDSRANRTLKKKNTVGGLTLPNFKTYD